MIGLGLGLVRQAVRNASGQAWTPAQLFSNGEQGVWYEPKPEYLFQDDAGTVPVTADGDPVGYMQDLSGNGNHATQATSASRPIYRTDGVLHWLEFDGVDDYLPTQTIVPFSSYVKFTIIAGATGTPLNQSSILISQGSSLDNYSAVFARAGSSSNDFPAGVSGGVLAGNQEYFDSDTYDPMVLTVIADQQQPVVSIDINNVASDQSTDSQEAWVDSAINLGQRSYDDSGSMDGNFYGIAWVLDNAGDNIAPAQQYFAARSGAAL